MIDEQLSAHFKRSEFACKCGCGANNISLELVKKLENMRKTLKRPIIIISGVRCLKHNSGEGGVSGSAHVDGLAVDIAVNSGSERLEIITNALFVGITRIGVANTFVHIDIDKSKPIDVLWTY